MEEVLDQREVEDGLEQLDVVRHRIDDLHVRRPVREEALLRQIDGVKLDDLVCRDGLRLLVNGVRDALGCGSTVRHIVLDTEVGIGTSGIVGGSEEDAAIGLVLADDVRGGGRGEDGVLADDELGNAVSGANLEDGLDGFGGEVATVATDDNSFALGVDCVEDGLDEVLGVVL